MKQFIASFVFAATLLTGVAFAGGNSSYTKAQQLLTARFPAASHITWSQDDQFIKAIFVLGGNGATAIFNREGELVAAARNLLHSQLPMHVAAFISQRFANDVVVGDYSEVVSDNDTHYRFTVEKGNKQFIVFICTDGTVSELPKKDDAYQFSIRHAAN